MSPVRTHLSALLEVEQEATAALGGLGGVVTAPEAQACLDELRFTLRWFCSGLTKHVRQRTKRVASDLRVVAPVSERLLAAPTGVDRIRLLTQTQRSVLVRVESILTGGLTPDLRAFLEQARVILAQSVHCCEEAIATLDRKREISRGPDL